MTELLRCNVFTCDSAPLPGSLYCNEHKPAPSAEPPEGWFPEEEWPGKPQPAPSAEAECEFVNSGQTGARSLDPWCRTHERSAICCLRDARALVPANQTCSGCAAARELLEESGSIRRDTPEHIHAVFAWLKEHP